jgi:hypothetical protein
MTTLLYDSDNPLSIPSDVDAAGYDDGYAASAWNTVGWARFPNAIHITLFAKPESDVFDIETGGGLPSQTPGWSKIKISQSKIGIVYVNRANGHLVEQELRGAGIPQDKVMLWIATDDGTQTVTVWDDGSAVYYPVWAVQYLNEAHGSGGHYDLSLVYLAFGGGGGTIGDEEMLQPTVFRNPIDGSEWQVDAMYSYKVGVTAAKANELDMAAKLLGFPGLRIIDNANVYLDTLPIGPPATGGNESAEPTKITLNIPGTTATGTIGA